MKRPTQQEFEQLVSSLKRKPRELVQRARDCGGCQQRRERIRQGLHRLSRWAENRD